MRLPYWMCLIGALGCSVERGRVDVVAFSQIGTSEPGPRTGAMVVFADRDGASRKAYIDADGHAAGEVEDGGSVWLVESIPEASGMNLYAAYADVHPGETLRFGPLEPPVRAKRGTMTVQVPTLPQPVDVVRISSPCGKVLMDGRLELDDRCGATADVLAVAWDLDRGGDSILSYAHLPAQPIVDGGTIVLGAGDFRPAEQVSVQLRNAAGVDGVIGLESSYGFRVPRTIVQGDRVTATVPAIGTLRWTARLRRDPVQLGQEIHFALPAAVSQEVDVNRLMTPWVVRDESRPGDWSADDLGGALAAQMMVTEHQWVQPIANFEESVNVRIVSAPELGGKIEVPRLPDALSKHQPGKDFQIETTVHLIRFEGGDPSQAAWLAERISGPGSFSLLAELPVTSYAIGSRF